MPVYHSSFNAVPVRKLGGIPLLPLKATLRGPAPPSDPTKEDIVDEAITFFRANVLFRNYDVQGDADRLLCYLTLYIQQCLKKCERLGSPAEAASTLTALAGGSFQLPGDPGFPLGALIPPPRSRDESDTIRAYFKQLRDEVGKRLVPRLYYEDGTPNKWWLCFAKRKFLNKELR
eukprot:PLAT1274.1.p1 GENE.PLAT1274.1~~PLAT1274.1.p1  ORF type:complete len:175 (-),score=75.81 PLAT1274.1:78-602(-)